MLLRYLFDLRAICNEFRNANVSNLVSPAVNSHAKSPCSTNTRFGQLVPGAHTMRNCFDMVRATWARIFKHNSKYYVSTVLCGRKASVKRVTHTRQRKKVIIARREYVFDTSKLFWLAVRYSRDTPPCI